MSDSEQAELKAGHPPAMKVGGKRVSLPKHHEDKPAEPAKEETEDKEKTSPNKNVVISGAHLKEKEIFSPEAAKVAHEKPMPTHYPTPQVHHHHAVNQQIQQPRKN